MPKWSVDRTREWVMKTLYATYVEDEHASLRWSIASPLEATETHPHGDDIIRQSRRLAGYGWIEILTEAYGCLFVQMTPAGRDVWEAFLKRKEDDPGAFLPMP